MSLHHEHHNKSSEMLRDFVIGMSDGLTVPFALAAGLAGATDSTALIVTAGVAEIAAGAIAMGLGGYMGAKTEAQHYVSEYARELHEVEKMRDHEIQETSDILREFGVPDAQIPIVISGITQDRNKWVDFMMRFELGLEKPDAKRLYQSPLVIGGAYVLGGLVPLAPYIALPHVSEALPISVAVSLAALGLFGAFKGYFTGQKMLVSALQTTGIGAMAAAAAFLIAAWVGA